jgi:hypothetical protein
LPEIRLKEAAIMNQNRNCEGMTRRDCLQLGLAGLAGGGLVNLLGVSAQAASAAKGPVAGPRAKSCIMIWLDGGPSHFETFDPKPNAPVEIRGEFDPIATKTPGVQFSEVVPKLASISDKLCIVRSIQHNQGNHGAGNHYMMTGSPTRIPVGCGAFVSFHPSFGAVTAYERGTPGGLPPYFSIPSVSRSGGPNFLGAKFAPFVVSDDPNSESFRVRDVNLPAGLTDDRFMGRRDLRKLVDKLPRFAEKAAGDPVQSVDAYTQQGYDLIASTHARQAFDINNEPAKTRDAYGRSGFGQRCLLARRLVEAGVPWITLYNGGWDDHSGIFQRFRERGAFEASVAALVTDLDERGMLEDTLVVMLGEFGRTPKISTLSGSKTAGRDHWANAMSVMFAGAGVPRGTVIGATDRNGYAANERVLSPENFASTIYRKLGIDPDKIYYTPQGRPTHLVSDPTPIKELMG